LKYRKEIDGLRAVAVLPVILFHASFAGFSGGYVGVDIFFVISGYLITSNILNEISRNQFSIVNFYERRARRILPALSIVLLFTSIAAFILMPAELLKSYSKSLVSVASFSSNIFFYLTSGYFSTVSDEKPLLHTWSLAVEEQYYIFFPIMISVLWGVGKKNLFKLLVGLTLCSLFFSQYLSMRGAVDGNFYLIFSRAWELLFGALIAFLNLKQVLIRRWLMEVIGALGLLLIIYSIIFFDKQTPFPSFYTLIPVLGAGLIIVFSDCNTLLGRFLSNKLFVAIGLISYSLYLWHQPIFAFLRLKTLGEPTHDAFVVAILIAVSLSYFSYRFIERPFRNKSKISRYSIFKYSLISLIIMITVGMIGWGSNGFEQSFKHNSYLATVKSSPKREECHTRGHKYLKISDACRYFGKNITWASFGDSHTVELAYSLAEVLKKKDEGLLHLSFSGCPPALLFDVNRPGCSKWVNEALNYLEKDDSIKHVLLGFRYTGFLFGSQLELYPEVPNKDPAYQFKGAILANTGLTPRGIYWQSFNEIVMRLLKAGKQVHIIYPIPELPVHISKVINPFSIFSDQTMVNIEETTTKEYYFKRNNFILNRLNSLAYTNKLHAIKPFEILCNSDFCPAVSDGKALYFDDNHLSIAGATEIIEKSGLGRLMQ